MLFGFNPIHNPRSGAQEQRPSRCKIRAWPLRPLLSADNSFSNATRSKSLAEVFAEVFDAILGLLKPRHQPCNRIRAASRAEHAILGARLFDDAVRLQLTSSAHAAIEAARAVTVINLMAGFRAASA